MRMFLGFSLAFSVSLQRAQHREMADKANPHVSAFTEKCDFVSLACVYRITLCGV